MGPTAARIKRSILWGALLTAPALLILFAALFGPGTLVDQVIRVAFGPLCHQIPARSFTAGGGPLVVCARCTGFYAGLALGGLGVAGYHIFRPIRGPRRWLLFLFVPLAVDGAANLLGIWESPALLRAATGVLAAVPLAALLMREP